MILMGVFSYNSSSCSGEPSIARFLFALTSPVLLSLSLVSFGFFISLHLASVQGPLWGACMVPGRESVTGSCPNCHPFPNTKTWPQWSAASFKFLHWHLMVVTQVRYEGIPDAQFFYKDLSFLRNFMSRFCQLRVNVGSSVMIKAVMTPREKTPISVKYKFIKQRNDVHKKTLNISVLL